MSKKTIAFTLVTAHHPQYGAHARIFEFGKFPHVPGGASVAAVAHSRELVRAGYKRVNVTTTLEREAVV